MRLNSKQYKTVLKLGTNKYDIIEPDRFAYYHLSSKIEELAISEIEPFLNYQIKDNPYQKVFYRILEDRISYGLRESPDKIEITMDWIDKQTNLKRKYKVEADQLFKEPTSAIPAKVDEWEYRLKKYINGRPIEETLLFLEYGKGLLKENYELHKLICSNPYGCQTNKAYELHIDEIDKLILLGEKQIKESKVKEEIKPFDRIQWKGTQAQLAELFIELKKNGWIGDFEKTAMKNCFTNSKSIEQYLVPYEDEDTKEPTYIKVYTKRYDAMFYGIKENPKK